MSEKSVRARGKRFGERRAKLIETLWGDDLEKLKIWNRLEHDGYTTVPRTLPYIIKVMDSLSEKGMPLASSYLALWCRVFDEGFIEIKDRETLAYESGFSGQRAVHTWNGRMKALKELGFIDSKSGPNGEFQYVIIKNPLWVIKEIYKKKDKNEAYNMLAARMIDVGAEWD